MNMHKNARLTIHGRALLVRRVIDEGLRPIEVAQAAGVSPRTVYKWLTRFRREGWAGLRDRSSRPGRFPHQTAEQVQLEVIALRHQRKTYRQISQITGVPPSTVGRILMRAGLNRLSELEPAKPAQRYVHDNPGDMLHLDTKKLGRFIRPGHRVTGSRQQKSRGAGWEYVHVAIDDASRVAFTTIHPDETGMSACKALVAALRYYAGFGHHSPRPH